MSGPLLTLAAAVVMEPVAAVVHRSVMHGRRGWAWHASHHRTQGQGIEANDLYPATFAAATVAAMAAGTAVERLRPLVWAGAGVTAYGAAYLLVHDLFVHARLGRLPGARGRYLRWVAAGHAVHHRTGRAPYGFLFPVVPRGR